MFVIVPLIWIYPWLHTTWNSCVIVFCLEVTVLINKSVTVVGFLMTPNLFVCSEVAFGYKGLQIQLFYAAGNLSTLFKVKYSSKVTETFDCVEVGRAFLYSFHLEVLTPLNVTISVVAGSVLIMHCVIFLYYCNDDGWLSTNINKICLKPAQESRCDQNTLHPAENIMF